MKLAKLASGARAAREPGYLAGAGAVTLALLRLQGSASILAL